MLGAGFTYEALRLYTYGKLESALISGEERNFCEMKKDEIEIQGKIRWEQLLPLNKASAFSTSLVVEGSWQVRDRFLSETLGVKHWIEALSFEGSFLLSYVVLFGSSDGYVLLQSPPEVFQTIVEVLFVVGLVLSYDRDRRNAGRLELKRKNSREETVRRGDGR